MKTLFILSLVIFFLKLSMASSIIEKRINIDGDSFRAIQISPAQISLHWKDNKGIPYRYFIKLKKDLQKRGKQILALMNAGIYSSDNSPAGLHIESSKLLKSLNNKRGKGNFHLLPNGIFFISKNNKADVYSTNIYLKYYGNKHKNIRLATQSGPMLLINGRVNKRFISNSKHLYSRNAICTTKNNKVWFIITSHHTKTNLYTLAKATKKLGCYQSLYLDGSISKLYQPGINSTFHLSHYVGILAVTK